MAAGSSITGFFEQDESTSRTQESGTSQTTQEQRQTGTRDVSETGSLEQLITQLDEGTLGGLQSLVQDLLSGAEGGEVRAGSAQELAAFISERAKSGDGTDTQAIVGEARRKGTNELQRIQQQLAKQSGGSIANTLVAGATGEAAVSLESQLAALETKLGITQRQTQTDELTKAFGSVVGAEQAGTQNLTSLLSILKGAQTGTQQTTERQTAEITDLQTLLESLTTTESVTIGEEEEQRIGIGGKGTN